MSKIYVAGATGVIGQRLIPLLLKAGHTVTGTSRSPAKAEKLRGLGVRPVVVDMFEPEAVVRSVREAGAEILIHQLTDLPAVHEPAAMAAARIRNARLREETAPTLLRAAREAGVHRIIVQSIAFGYAPGPLPQTEEDALAVPSVQAMEQAFLGQQSIDTVILRYGRLWGTGTWSEAGPAEAPTVHVDAAAHAALLAMTPGKRGIYHIAEPTPRLTVTRAHTELGFDPAFRVSR